jgi:hypothetical protein
VYYLKKFLVFKLLISLLLLGISNPVIAIEPIASPSIETTPLSSTKNKKSLNKIPNINFSNLKYSTGLHQRGNYTYISLKDKKYGNIYFQQLYGDIFLRAFAIDWRILNYFGDSLTHKFYVGIDYLIVSPEKNAVPRNMGILGFSFKPTENSPNDSDVNSEIEIEKNPTTNIQKNISKKKHRHSFSGPLPSLSSETPLVVNGVIAGLGSMVVIADFARHSGELLKIVIDPNTYIKILKIAGLGIKSFSNPNTLINIELNFKLDAPFEDPKIVFGIDYGI